LDEKAGTYSSVFELERPGAHFSVPRTQKENLSMKKGKVVFTGEFWPYFGKLILLNIGCIFTLGLLMPYTIFWSQKYFFEHMEIELNDE